MKASRVFLVILITAAAFTAAVNIFSDNRKEVEIAEVTEIEYADSVVLSGSIFESASTIAGTDGSAQALSQTKFYVTAYVGENNISKIRLGQSATVSGSGFKDKTYSATVTKIGDTAKKVSVGGVKLTAVEVTLLINEPDDLLKSGFSASARIYTEDMSNVALVPYTAVILKNGKEYVYLYEDDTAVLTSIKTGRELVGGYEVVSGIKSGDRVIANPNKISGEICDVTVVSGAEG